MSEKMWMVRAGENAYLIEDFKDKNMVAVGWHRIKDLSNIDVKRDYIINLIKEKYPELKDRQVITSGSQFYKFIKVLKLNDYVISYDPNNRQYSIGKVKSDYLYKENICQDYSNYRKVEWLGIVNRDDITTSTKNTLGAISTLFEIKDSGKKEILLLFSGGKPGEIEGEEEDQDLDILRADVFSRASEFIKDKVMSLNWEEMQELVASILRAMGFKTSISDKGPDRGNDIVASPDGLGLENPRIFVEVKHRTSQVDSKQIRSFIGALRTDAKGLYVSTGGFTKDARYEAERSNIPITLIDSNKLVNLIIQNYDNFDIEGRALIPLLKVYWPA